MDNEDKQVLLVIAIAFMFALGLFLGGCISSSGYKRSAIKHGAGQYNPTNGWFEWTK